MMGFIVVPLACFMSRHDNAQAHVTDVYIQLQEADNVPVLSLAAYLQVFDCDLRYFLSISSNPANPLNQQILQQAMAMQRRHIRASSLIDKSRSIAFV